MGVTVSSSQPHDPGGLSFRFANPACTLARDYSPDQMAGTLDFWFYDSGSYDVNFHCGCSWKRVLGALKMLGVAELQDMIDKDEGAEAICQFCGEVYQANETQLTQLIADLRNE